MSDKKTTVFVQGAFPEVKTFQNGDSIQKLGINLESFIASLKPFVNEKGFVNIEIATARSGKQYAKVNTFGMSPNEVETAVRAQQEGMPERPAASASRPTDNVTAAANARVNTPSGTIDNSRAPFPPPAAPQNNMDMDGDLPF